LAASACDDRSVAGYDSPASERQVGVIHWRDVLVYIYAVLFNLLSHVLCSMILATAKAS
jgi:hypothetical protein